jgi:hypothetical protein
MQGQRARRGMVEQGGSALGDPCVGRATEWVAHDGEHGIRSSFARMLRANDDAPDRVWMTQRQDIEVLVDAVRIARQHHLPRRRPGLGPGQPREGEVATRPEPSGDDPGALRWS